MPNTNSADSPLEAAAGVAGAEATEAFGLLANKTRLAILLALWEAKEPEQPCSEQAVPFSKLYEGVGIGDSGNFTYHLDKLNGTFVRSTDGGYKLSNTASRVLRAVFAGTLTEDRSFKGKPSDFECYRCGSLLVVDYTDENETIQRCPGCEGAYEWPEYPSGMVAHADLPPAALENRTPQEMQRKGNTWIRNRLMTLLNGVCPDCAGRITTTAHVCDAHDAASGTVCENCGSVYEVRLLHVCEVCKFDWWLSLGLHIITELPVKIFYHDHGIDLERAMDESSITVLYETIEEQTVVSEDPLEFLVRVELDGDRLDVTLGATGDALDVSEVAG
jgi:transcription elongation factor Elf1